MPFAACSSYDAPPGTNVQRRRVGGMTGSTSAAPGRIFICYRRAEADFPAGWLYERLVARFGREQVFKDVDSIELGDDFAEAIADAVGACDALIALIGDQWLTITDEAGRRRLEDPNDFVRLEIEAALERNVRVIPILVGNASMPRVEQLPASLVRLARRQALELSPNHFMSATGLLLRVLDKTIAEAQAKREAEAQAKREAEAQAKREHAMPGVGMPSNPLRHRVAPVEPGSEAKVEAEARTKVQTVPSSMAPPSSKAPSDNRLNKWIAITVAAVVMIGIAIAIMRAPNPRATGQRTQSSNSAAASSTSTTAHKAPGTTLAPLDANGVPTNWKRFVDRRQKFSFLYPQDWAVDNQGYVAMTGPGGLSMDIIVYPGSRVRDPLQVLRDYAPMVDGIDRSIRLEGGKFAGRRAGFWEFTFDSTHELIVNFFRGSDRFSLHFIAPDGRSWSQLRQVMKYFERSFKVD
jgi:TIR domain